MSQDTVASVDTSIKAFGPGMPHSLPPTPNASTKPRSTPCTCLCSAITFSYTGPLLGVATELCHCTSCQKWTGGAFTANITIDKSNFHHPRSPAPAPADPAASTPLTKYTSTGLSGKKIHFFFCGRCGSGLWNEPEVTPQWICVKAGCVDDAFVRSLGLGGMKVTPDGEGRRQEVGGMSGGKHVDVEFFVKDRVGYQRVCEGARQEEKM